jgi:hypothetical protein
LDDARLAGVHCFRGDFLLDGREAGLVSSAAAANPAPERDVHRKHPAARQKRVEARLEPPAYHFVVDDVCERRDGAAGYQGLRRASSRGSGKKAFEKKRPPKRRPHVKPRSDGGIPARRPILGLRFSAVVNVRDGIQGPRGEARQAQAPPMPRTMRPVPSQFGQAPPRAALPEPLHSGQISSPVPGVPGGASSPGLVRGAGCVEGWLTPVPLSASGP